MKNLLKISILTAALTACSSDNIPTPQKLGVDVRSLPANSVIAVLAKEDFPTPKNSQIIEKQSAFKVIDSVYSQQGTMLVRKNSIISGTYTNDGVTCRVTWKSIYANKSNYEDNIGTFSLGAVTEPTPCDPVKGIKEGQRVMIRANQQAVLN